MNNVARIIDDKKKTFIALYQIHTDEFPSFSLPHFGTYGLEEQCQQH